jgi:putative ABC transport system permease protein
LRARSWIALAARESRGSAGRLAFFAACLSVGVAAVVAVAGLSRALDSGIQAQARQLLAADLAINSRRDIPSQTIAAVDALPGARRSAVRELPTVVSVPGASEASGAPGASLLCELKAVEPGYPFYGRVETSPEAPLQTLLEADAVLVGPELLSRLDVTVGDRLRVGEALFTIAGTITREPDRRAAPA